VRGNALEPRTYQDHLAGACAAISCVGGFGSQEVQLRINGAANVAAIEAAAAAGVPRFVFVSANIPAVPGIELALGGYIRGKREAEAALSRCFPGAGVALRPGVVHGDRVVSASVTLPLGLVFGPLEFALRKLPTERLAALPLVGGAFVPPISAKELARLAVRAASDPSFPAGVLDPWQMQKML